MRINTNISAIISNNALQKAQNSLSGSIQRLSSGYKINSSADDPAGCAISEKMRIQIRGLEQAKNNTTDGISVLNTAEGAIVEIQSMLTRFKELTVQAANDVNSDDERSAIQQEIDNINAEIDRISEQTEFNTQPLINGNLSRRVYSDYQGVNQISISDSFTAGIYGVTITQDARQAVAVGSQITMSSTDTISSEQAGTISVNGYQINILEGDTLDVVMDRIMTGVGLTGGKAFAVSQTTSDTKTNGTDYAGYKPETSYTGNRLVIMTEQYGRDQKLDISCDNEELAGLLGISDAYDPTGLGKCIHAEGSDVEAEFAKADDGSRAGFEDSAVISTKGTRITVQLAIDTVDTAISYVNSVRSKIGAYENRFEHTNNNLEVSDENVTKALSAKIDTDMAEEMTEYTSQTVLTQAATSILSQANQRPSEVLQLLQK